MHRIIIVGIDCLPMIGRSISILSEQPQIIILETSKTQFEPEPIVFKAPKYIFDTITVLADEPVTNERLWFNGNTRNNFEISGKKQNRKYKSRKKSRNNKHK